MYRVAVLFVVGCGRIHFDPAVLTDAGNDAPPARALCFAPRVDLELCTTCTFPDPMSVTTGDIDRDGHIDIAVGDDQLGTIGVRRGLGDGTFGPPEEYAIDYDAQELRLVDLDADNVLDLVAVSWNSNGVRIFYGDGTGAFEPVVVVPGPTTPVALDVADVDGDGTLDLVTGGEDNRIRFMRGLGARTYAVSVTLLTAVNFYAVRVLDLDGNGRLDIVATDKASTLTVLLQEPAGTWSESGIPVPVGATGVAAGDFDRDGRADLAIAAQLAGVMTLLLGDGAGGFAQRTVDAGPAPIWPVAADLDLDGDLDLVVTQANGGLLSIFVNAGDATFARTDHVLATDELQTSIHDLAKADVGDFNGDGYPDIVAANPAGADVAVLLSTDPSECP